MIRTFATVAGRMSATSDADSNALWLDLINPVPEEERAIERLLGINVPTREDMDEIEISSRLYQEDGAAFMTAILPAHAERDDPEMAPVTFVLTADRLVTVRYHDPGAFSTFPLRAEKSLVAYPDAESLLIGLLEAIVDRHADILENASQMIDDISRSIFRRDVGTPRNFQTILEEIGRKGELTSNMRDSLLTLERLSGFLGNVSLQRNATKMTREALKTLSQDIRSLLDHAGFLSQKITFLLDATLGMISIEQNATIKIFSIAAVIFLPPTLIASMYGMNFEYMPELQWPLGYPFAIGLMIISAILPYAYFKKRGWL